MIKAEKIIETPMCCSHIFNDTCHGVCYCNHKDNAGQPCHPHVFPEDCPLKEVIVIRSTSETHVELKFPKNPINSDGYPTKKALKYFKNQYIYSREIEEKFFTNLITTWDNMGGYDHSTDTIPDYGHVINLSTGGWSGCEDLIAALESNRLFWQMYFVSYVRGGHYTFKRHFSFGGDME